MKIHIDIESSKYGTIERVYALKLKDNFPTIERDWNEIVNDMVNDMVDTLQVVGEEIKL